jgi:hypothetical protein
MQVENSSLEATQRSLLEQNKAAVEVAQKIEVSLIEKCIVTSLWLAGLLRRPSTADEVYNFKVICYMGNAIWEVK